MKTQKKKTLPSIARGTSPSYLNRLVVLLYADDRHEVFAAPTEEARDQFIEDVVRSGQAVRVHLHCPDPGCGCTFPTLLLNDDGSPAETKTKAAKAKSTATSMKTRNPYHAISSGSGMGYYIAREDSCWESFKRDFTLAEAEREARALFASDRLFFAKGATHLRPA